jgi:sigma-E factor negative regulatory protein RseC
MIEQNVQVVACRGERIWVRLGSQSGCTACDNGNGCGAGVFAKLLQRKPVVLELEQNELSVKPGQMVTLAFPEQVYMKLVFASYGWPLLAALVGAFAGHGLGEWLQLGPGLIDIVTLSAGLLAGGFTMRFIKGRGDTGTVLRSLNTMVYYPAETPDMCNSAVKDPQQF